MLLLTCNEDSDNHMRCHRLDDVARLLSSPSIVVARLAAPASVKKRKGRGTDVAYLVVDPHLYPSLLVIVCRRRSPGVR
jgi:hypothetical protein